MQRGDYAYLYQSFGLVISHTNSSHRAKVRVDPKLHLSSKVLELGINRLEDIWSFSFCVSMIFVYLSMILLCVYDLVLFSVTFI